MRHGEIENLRPLLSDDEYGYLLRLLEGRGLPFTIEVQRSWCKGRARDAAYLTLAMLPESTQQHLLERWVEHGGGTASFFANEADAFLEFISGNLKPCTHELSICRMEQAVHRAARGNAEMTVPVASVHRSFDATLTLSRHSTLVEFHCDPERLFAALRNGTSLPESNMDSITLLFAPWLPGYFRYARDAEISLITSIRSTITVSELFASGHDLQCIDALLIAGAIVDLGNAQTPT